MVQQNNKYASQIQYFNNGEELKEMQTSFSHIIREMQQAHEKQVSAITTEFMNALHAALSSSKK